MASASSFARPVGRGLDDGSPDVGGRQLGPLLLALGASRVLRQGFQVQVERVLRPALVRLAVDPQTVASLAQVAHGRAGSQFRLVGPGVAELEAEIGQASHLTFHFPVGEGGAGCGRGGLLERREPILRTGAYQGGIGRQIFSGHEDHTFRQTKLPVLE